MPDHPAEAAAGMVKKAVPWLLVPAALAAMPTLTYLMNRLSGHDPTKAKKPKQPPIAPAPESSWQGIEPDARGELYRHLFTSRIPTTVPHPLLRAAQGLHGYRAGL